MDQFTLTLLMLMGDKINWRSGSEYLACFDVCSWSVVSVHEGEWRLLCWSVSG